MVNANIVKVVMLCIICTAILMSGCLTKDSLQSKEPEVSEQTQSALSDINYPVTVTIKPFPLSYIVLFGDGSMVSSGNFATVTGGYIMKKMSGGNKWTLADDPNNVTYLFNDANFGECILTLSEYGNSNRVSLSFREKRGWGEAVSYPMVPKYGTWSSGNINKFDNESTFRDLPVTVGVLRPMGGPFRAPFGGGGGSPYLSAVILQTDGNAKAWAKQKEADAVYAPYTLMSEDRDSVTYRYVNGGGGVSYITLMSYPGNPVMGASAVNGVGSIYEGRWHEGALDWILATE
uniref:Uncharacterized protein n=1 Tax=Candidatus Methanogaster sp. ANME-2c ERB4 TaxID=2759911 RepID=A0A7G9YMY0_9EURY|nr:hypothetical protein ICHGDBFH_00019 [Methanosarcinales archaeon ANME-2c ERB4]